MALVRSVLPTLAAVVMAASSLGAQATGSIRGRVVDTASNLPLGSVVISLEGVNRATSSRTDGTYELNGVPTGLQRVRARRIGYAGQTLQVSVRTDAVATANFELVPSALALTEVVVTGYGTTKREAITGSVATVDATDANKGVVTNATQLLQGRVAGLEIVQNSGEPGAGAQIRIRGGTSINASNDPLYVVDGLPLQNDGITPGATGVGGINPALGRNSLKSINPDDIESITILKDASATAIYGSRGANGVVLIQTKRGANRGGISDMVYETSPPAATPTKSLGLLTGSEYRT